MKVVVFIQADEEGINFCHWLNVGFGSGGEKAVRGGEGDRGAARVHAGGGGQAEAEESCAQRLGRTEPACQVKCLKVQLL